MPRILPAAALLLAVSGMVDAKTIWKDYPGFYGPGKHGIVAGDFDGNGTQEVAVTGFITAPGEPSNVIAVVGRNGEAKVGTLAVTPLPYALEARIIAAPREDGKDRLLSLSNAGLGQELVVWGEIPLRRIRTIPIVGYSLIDVGAVADVDDDGTLEVVGVSYSPSTSPGRAVVLDFDTGAVEWDGSTATTSVAVGQLDQDAQLELIVSGQPGLVVDGKTHLTDWSYPSGFAGRTLVGNFNDDPATTEFATFSFGYIEIFQASPYSPVSDFEYAWQDTAGVHNVTPDAIDEIVVGSGTYGNVSVFDPRTGSAIRSFQREQDGVSATAVADIDGDGSKELVYGSGLTSTGEDVLRAIDLVTGLDDYEQADEGGPFSATAMGDFAGNGQQQAVYMTWEADSGYSGATLRVLDFATGSRKASRKDVLELWDPYQGPWMVPMQLDADAPLELAVAGSYSYVAAAAVLDGATWQDQWRRQASENPLGQPPFLAMTGADMNGDGKSDLVAATNASRIVVLDGTSGVLLWQSETIAVSGTLSVVAANLDDDPAIEVALAYGSTVSIFDGATHLLQGTIDSASPVSALITWGAGANCRLGLLGPSTSMGVYRCDNRAFDRNQTVPANTLFIRTLDDGASHFLAAAGGYLYEVLPDGTSRKVSEFLGERLGHLNKGAVREVLAPYLYDAVMGSDLLVAGLKLNLDVLFEDDFD